MTGAKKKILGMNPDLESNSWPIASTHSLYAMIGEDPRSIDDFYSSGAHIECRALTMEPIMVTISLTCTS